MIRQTLLAAALFTSLTHAWIKADIEVARPGGVSRTLDAFVPDGDEPFATVTTEHHAALLR